MATTALDTRYDLAQSRIYVTGTQALVRLCLMQRAADARAGLNTAGYVSGYRGSPLGALDQQFPAAQAQLEAANIHFEPALNEDLAATALWGTQQAEIRGEGRYDGVFGLWYGKGPGVDRTGDVFRHANFAGSSRHGGVLVLTGDDHTCESSTAAHQSEFAMQDALIPVLNPATVRELITFGLHGWAMSRYSGLWVALKAVKDNIESTASIDIPADAVVPVLPQDFQMPEGGLNIRPHDHRLEQESRTHDYKLRAAQAYVRVNRLDERPGGEAADATVGIISTGKSWLDTVQALEELGIAVDEAAAAGLRLYKVAMTWPLEPEGVRAFAHGLREIIVVEEKRSLIETQLREILYGTPDAPKIVGKRDEQGQTLFQPQGALNPVQIALAIGKRLPGAVREDPQPTPTDRGANRLHHLHNLLTSPVEAMTAQRVPWFCAGCPHNTSTRVPEGARAYAGIGCHWMAQIMERNTDGCTQMGGEGANWIGESRFSTREHVFQNLGDGTYNHSGLLAIRAALASNTRITYKILYNDAVAMTGGQTHEGGLSPYQIAAEVSAAGITGIAWVSDAPDAVDKRRLPPGTQVYHRDELQSVQAALARRDGVSVLLYEQTCAAEKRRRRKRGTMVDPAHRVFINTAVCEGCGDCGEVSNCVAIAPVETVFGRKRRIDQSVCNKDFSCVNGFCPSFVTIEGGRLRRPELDTLPLPELPQPSLPAFTGKPYAIALTGVGGTGVVTVAALLGMAAHLENKGCGIIDMAGLAQKNGAVVSHIKLAARPEGISAIRIAHGGADLLLGCDLMVSASAEILDCVNPETARAVVNVHEIMPGAFTRNPDYRFPDKLMLRRIGERVSQGRLSKMDATGIAENLFGQSVASNLMLLGLAWQSGAIPLSLESLQEAIRLNGVAVDMNLQAFHWGRVWAVDQNMVEEALRSRQQSQWQSAVENVSAETLDFSSLQALHREHLTAYQNSAWAERYQQSLDAVAAVDATPDKSLARAAARSLVHLMSYKDEYEVARLLTSSDFENQINTQFDGEFELKYHLAPPLLSRPSSIGGRPRKYAFGPWLKPMLRQLARARGVRGKWFDPFSYTRERRQERQLIKDYQALLARVPQLREQLPQAQLIELLALPLTIRGYGPIKEASIKRYQQRQSELLRAPQPESAALAKEAS